jgi:competence protein ComEA
MPQISRGRALAYVVLLLAVLTFAGRAAFRTEGEAAPAVPPLSLRAEPPPAGKLLVHVVGAVRSPGLYELADGQQVALPLRGTAEEAAAPGSPANSVSGTRVHLNTATLEDLDSLPGIGPITAQKILDYRAEHGAFSSVDELDAVSGIGPATLAELRELVDL